MKKYSVIVFDLGNVLIPFDYTPFIKKLNGIQDGLGDKFARKYKKNYHFHREYESGKLSTDEFLGIMLKWTDNKMTGVQFSNSFSRIFSVNKKVVNLLPELKKRYKLVILSNTNPIHQKRGWGNYGFLKYFDKQILSHEAGSVKPERKIYRAVEEYTRQPASKHFYIDDIAAYVQAAKRMGWGGVQFTSYENLKEELEKRKIL
ncbi:MAG: HAD-IA family hydrolase [Melioribacteraceae bacterium]